MLNDGRQVLTSTLLGSAGTLTGIFENGEVNVMVDWLAGNRTAKVLAAPTLTVLSGHTAGAEFPNFPLTAGMLVAPYHIRSAFPQVRKAFMTKDGGVTSHMVVSRGNCPEM